MKNLFRNFYVQFFLISVIILLVYRWFNPKSQDENVIYINEGTVEALKVRNGYPENFTKQELDYWIQNYLKDEVAYRKAVDIGLEKNDDVIRRILISKYEFLQDEGAKRFKIDEKILREFYQKHPQRYWKIPIVSFYQILKRSDQNERPEEKITAIKHSLDKQTPIAEVLKRSDTYSVPNYFPETDIQEVKKYFGENFGEKLLASEQNEWIGPLKSGMGYHLVYLSEVHQNEIKDFDEVREKVEEDYRLQRGQEVKDSLLLAELKNYEVQYSSKVKKMLNP